jgi:hypothetical protein
LSFVKSKKKRNIKGLGYVFFEKLKMKNGKKGAYKTHFWDHWDHWDH